MRWFWQRRKKDARSAPEEQPRGTTAVAEAPRPGGASGRLEPAREPADALLRFARDLLNAQGARVRVEEDDLVVATQVDGAIARYTTTLARARAEEDTSLLTPGAAALEGFFDEAAQRARYVALRLTSTGDPVAMALRAVAPAPLECGNCVGQGSEPWLAGAPSCQACPLRAGRLALVWSDVVTGARLQSQQDTLSVELTYRISGRDRRGRRDEWIRLAYDAGTGRTVAPLTLEQVGAAQQLDAPADSYALAQLAGERAREALTPAVEAFGAYLRQRVADEFQRRVEEVTTTHERLKRERPQEAHMVASALDHELASLAEVYGVEVEARLESVCVVSSPVAMVVVETARGVGPVIQVDMGRNAVAPPVCAVCDEMTHAGSVCAHGHVLCPKHASSCAQCGKARCQACGDQTLEACALCHDTLCAECARSCADCGRTFCADHLWTCQEGDRALCVEHLALCDECQTPLCAEHTLRCAVCDDTLCSRHARVCKTGGEILCGAHAQACAMCGQALCEAHAVRCEECGDHVCRDDTFACLGCGRTLCRRSAPAACMSCGVEYCAQCRGEAGMCPGCRSLAPADDDALAILARVGASEPAINLKRAWRVGRNARAYVFISRGVGRQEVYVVTDEGDLAGSRRKGWLAR